MESFGTLSSRNPRDELTAWTELGVRSKPTSLAYLPTSLGIACLSPTLAVRPWVLPLVIVLFSWLSFYRWRKSRALAEMVSLNRKVKREFDRSILIACICWSTLVASVLYLGQGWEIGLNLLLLIAMGAGALSSMTMDFSLFSRFQAILALITTSAILASDQPYSLTGGCFLMVVGFLATAMGYAANRNYWQNLERNRHQMEELASARERLEMVVSGSNLGTFDWLPCVHEIHFDAKMAEVLGRPPEKFEPYCGSPMDLVYPDDLELMRSELVSVLKSTDDLVHEIEVRFQAVGHEFRWFVFRGRVVQRDRSARATRIAGTYEHITAQKEAEQALEVMKSRVAQAEKLQTLGVLAGGVAHDFNNLLMAIYGNLELVELDIPREGEAAESLSCAKTAALDAASLCDQLLAYAGKGKFSIQKFNLSELVREMAHLLQVTIGRNNSLTLELEDEAPLVEGDISQLRQVVMNLITNASESMEACSGGTITLRTYLAPESEFASPDPELLTGDFICLEVVDQGCGMNEETLRRIFDPFFTTKFTGRGLGLASALGIARAHHGELRVESAPGEGTVFRLYLPTTETLEMIEENGIELRRPISPIKILVVDDEASVRRISQSILSKVGHEVLLAKDGLDALEQLGAHPGEVALVLLDLTMPRKDGYQTLLEIRQKWPTLPVVLSSGYSADEVMQKAQAKVQGFLKKPFTKEQLLQEVGRVQV